MLTIDELTLYFFIACGIACALILLIIIWLTCIHVKLRKLKLDNDIIDGLPYGRGNTTCDLRRGTYTWEWNKSKKISNQLSRQTNMMSDFCYTNPTIVKGEELDRRGFSMYSGSSNFAEDFATKTKDQYGTYNEARSKF